MAPAGQKPVTVTRPLSWQEIAFLLCSMVRHQSLLEDASRELTRGMFTPTESAFLCLWDAISDAGQRRVCDSQPALAACLAAATARLPDSGDRQAAQEYGEQLLAYAFAHPAQSFDVDLATQLLRRFLTERGVLLPMRREIAANPATTPAAMDALLQRYMNMQERISATGGLPTNEAMPAFGTVIERPVTLIPTGIRYIDDRLGGQRTGDANGLIGVTGTGKSTLAANIVVAAGRLAYADAIASDSRPAQSVLFSYEEPKERIDPRVWSCAARIRRDKLEPAVNWEAMTSRDLGNLEEYEQQLQARGAGALVFGERERWQMTREWLGHVVRVMDMSGSADFAGFGSGGVREIAAIMERMASRDGATYRTVVIDYAGLVVRRYMEAHGIRQEQTRQLLKSFVDECRRQIAERYNCTVWVLHQVKGDAGNWAPTRLVHHTDSGECKDFAENAAVCGCIGPYCKTTGCRFLNFSKVRYRQGERIKPVVVRIDDTLADVIDVTGQYLVAANNRGFVSRSDTARVLGLDG